MQIKIRVICGALLVLLGSPSVQAEPTAMARVGIVIGVIDPQGRRVTFHSALEQSDPYPFDGDTVFEIGSVTKVFTSLILADMMQRRQVGLDDPVQKYLPSTVHVPMRGGKQITLRNLATHSSGLPREPDNRPLRDRENPYADYSVDLMYDFLNRYMLPRDIGAAYEYSNIGVGLLGNALSRRSGMDYEKLVRDRILKPLGMNSTAVTLTPDMRAHLAVAHGAKLTPVKNWDIVGYTGAGELRSTANDLLTFLAAELGYTASPLTGAMAAQLLPRRPTDHPNIEMALGWMVQTNSKGTVVFHNGGTGGYRAFIGFNSATRTGVVVLQNISGDAGPEEIGLRLLTGLSFEK